MTVYAASTAAAGIIPAINHTRQISKVQDIFMMSSQGFI